MASTRQFGRVNLTSDEGAEHAMEDAFQHVAQGLVLVQEALRMQQERTAQWVQEALLHHEESSTAAIRETLRRVEHKMQEREEALCAMELRLTAQIANLEERMSVVEARVFGGCTEIAKAGSHGRLEEFEPRLKNLEVAVQRALDCVFPRVDALLLHFQKPPSSRMSCGSPSSCVASVSASTCPLVPSLSTDTSTSISVSHSPTVTASRPQRPASIVDEASVSEAEDGAGENPATNHQGAVSDEECEKLVVEFRVQEILTRHNASARSTRLGEKLCWAVIEKELQYVRYLLDSGADVNYTAMHGDSPLISALACQSPKPNIVSLLLGRGADVNSIDMYGMSPLHHAAANDHKCLCVPLLIRSGANLNARDKDGETPLHWAAAKSNEGALRALVAAGARKDLKSWSGRWKNLTPFDIAVSDVFQKLLRQ